MLISSGDLFPLPEDSVHSTLTDVEDRAEVELILGVGRAKIQKKKKTVQNI